MADELIDICNDKNELTGEQILRSSAHKKGLWHRSVHVCVYNSKGQILLQKRSKTVSVFPDRWDIFVAGHISAGDNPKNTAIRELNEEIGLNPKKEKLMFYGIRKEEVPYKNIVEKEFDYIYLYQFNGDRNQLNRQKEEVSELKFIGFDDLEKKLKVNPKLFVPRITWFEVLNEIKKTKF